METDFYNRFYVRTEKSRVHSQFCEYVFGVDLCQHGFADREQLALLIEAGGLMNYVKTFKMKKE